MNEAKCYSRENLTRYLEHDFVLEALEKHPEDLCFASQNWFLDIPAKRMMYVDVYKPFLDSKGKKILDVGGGFCTLSRTLIKNHHYTLLDTMTRDDHEQLRKIDKDMGHFWENKDWAEFEPKEMYDVVIANDIFPNVDQRLEKFLKKFVPHTKELILTLTCYDQKSLLADFFEKCIRHGFALFQRVDADKLTITRAPSTEMTNDMLRRALGDKAPKLVSNHESLFKNGRVVYKIVIS